MKKIDIQGHRGARGLLPENSLPGFTRALELGVSTLELDVVISKDHRVVVSHDPVFSSELCSLPDGTPISTGTDADYRLFDYLYDDIRSFDCGSRPHPRFPDQDLTPVRKPLLEEVIILEKSVSQRLGRAPAHFNIETKCTPAGDNVLHPEPMLFSQLVVKVLRDYHILERSIIQSFDPRTLVAVHSLEPSVRTAALISKEQPVGIEKVIEILGFVPTIYSPDYELLTPELVKAVHDRGMKLIPWTINAVEDLEHAIGLGVDGIITDYPDRALALVS